MTTDAPNLRRRVRSLERRLDAAGTLYLVSFMCLTGAAAFLVLSVLCWAGVVAMVRAW